MLKECKRRAEVVTVIAVEGRRLTVDCNHVHSGLGGKAVQIDIAGIFNGYHVVLATLCVKANLRIVVLVKQSASVEKPSDHKKG